MFATANCTSQEAADATPFTAEEQIENFTRLVKGVTENAPPDFDINPHLFLWYGRQVLVFPMDQGFANPQTRHDIASAIRVAINQTNPSGFGIIMPAWTKQVDARDYKPGMSVSDYEDKTEVVFMYAETIDGAHKAHFLPVERYEDKTPTYGEAFEPPEGADMRGSFANVFSDKALPMPSLPIILYVMQFLSHIMQIMKPLGWKGLDKEVSDSFPDENRTLH